MNMDLNLPNLYFLKWSISWLRPINYSLEIYIVETTLCTTEMYIEIELKVYTFNYVLTVPSSACSQKSQIEFRLIYTIHKFMWKNLFYAFVNFCLQNGKFRQDVQAWRVHHRFEYARCQSRSGSCRDTTISGAYSGRLSGEKKC